MAAGILLSRLAGFARQRVLAHYLGLTWVADAFTAAFRIPNVLQNLFGEGALSASFIPAYARLLARRREEDARRLAGAVASLLGLVIAVLVLVGIVTAPWLLGLIAPGFEGERRDLALRLVRVFFPGAGLLVFSAWCLGVLNSHRRFLLSYAAPVVWNGAIVAGLLLGGDGNAPARMALIGAWASVVGSALQVLVQLPLVWHLGRPRLGAPLRGPEADGVVRNFLPALTSRGVVQISAYIDTLIASYLPVGAVAAMLNAQTLYTLPVSVFGISIAASELPEMSSLEGNEADRGRALRDRLARASRRLAFYVVPSAIAFLTLGEVIAAALFQTGMFTARDSRIVWYILAGSALGLLSGTAGRLWASAYYALGDTRTPLRFALVRIALTIGLGLVAALLVPGWLGIDRMWGATGLTATASLAGWVEFLLLRRGLAPVVGRVPWQGGYLARLVVAAVLAGAAAWGALLALPVAHPVWRAAVATVPFGAVYLAITMATGVPEARDLAGQLGRRLSGRNRPT